MSDETISVGPVTIGETLAERQAELQTPARRGVSIQRATRGAHRVIADVLDSADFSGPLASYPDAVAEAIHAQIEVLIARHRASSV